MYREGRRALPSSIESHQLELLLSFKTIHKDIDSRFENENYSSFLSCDILRLHDSLFRYRSTLRSVSVSPSFILGC